MKITLVQPEVFPDPLIPQLLARVNTDVGLTGVGEAGRGLPPKGA
ncbi:MAG: hypothetical protein AB1641_03275 [Thermodesulfobacteriota bacterium]